jgi:electron transfer flavoprotein alpha subunit
MKEFWVCVSPDYEAALGLVSRIRELADLGGALTAVLAFEKHALGGELFRAGAQKIYCMQKADDDEGIARQAAALCKKYQPEVLLFPATVAMRCAASFTAALLECGLCADCTAVSLREDGRIIMTRPTFADTLLADIVCEKSRPQMATVRPGIYLPVLGAEKTGCVIPPLLFAGETGRTIKLLEEAALDQNPLADARIIVSGGKGVGPTGFAKLKRLADLLGASLGASRGAVNSGYAPYLHQVGLTGVTVHPDVYLAFGISGAVQHIVGMSGAKHVIAVNPDRKAPIFEHADLAIVSPWEETADALIHRLSASLGIIRRIEPE